MIFVTVKSGVSASQVASSVYKLISVIGSTNVYISLISAAITMFSAFQDISGIQSVTDNYEDYIQIKVDYKNYDKWTYVYLPNILGDYNWDLCTETQKVIVTEITTLQHYANIDNPYDDVYTYYYPNAYIYSEHYINSHTVAVAYSGTVLIEKLSSRINGTNIYLWY